MLFFPFFATTDFIGEIQLTAACLLALALVSLPSTLTPPTFFSIPVSPAIWRRVAELLAGFVSVGGRLLLALALPPDVYRYGFSLHA